MTQVVKAIQAEVLTVNAYRNYGDVISDEIMIARTDLKAITANLGTAQKYNFVSSMINLRPATAKPNLAFYKCTPMLLPSDTIFEVTLLERHEFSTQVFIPMKNTERYMAIVCLGKESPDLSTLRAFIVNRGQAISYKPGVWHHPLVAMDIESDFTCFVFEDGSEGDCEVKELSSSVGRITVRTN